jgi:two-component system phosphate regulon sensor histidine kinase PhoR
MDELNLTLGEERHVLTHWVPLMEGGDLQGIVAVFHDITDLKKLENVRRDFVANVSHELRTPVTVIKGYAEALLSGNLEEDQDRARRFMEIIYSHAERLASLIGDLLTLSQLESGNLKLDQTHIHLEQAVRHVVGLLEQKWAHKAITVDTSAMTSVPPVLADPGRLEQVIINLLDNAIKYTPHGGTITFVARETDDTVTIGVRDSGIGIPSKDLPRIFERFYRVDAARSREEGGTGLGLSIVKHIIQLHGGAVDVDSETGKGSTFWFTLKRASGGA